MKLSTKDLIKPLEERVENIQIKSLKKKRKTIACIEWIASFDGCW